MDGAEGMHRNIKLIETVREVVGDGIDIMVDAYMVWTLDANGKSKRTPAPLDHLEIKLERRGHNKIRRRSP